MRTKLLVIVMLLFACAPGTGRSGNRSDQTIFVYGGEFNLKFVRYVAELTGKERPRICFLPTASADNEKNIDYWNRVCDELGLEPAVVKVWVSSSPANRSFEETLLDCDAIVVGGGNTLNMLGIWKAQGIDRILKRALERGIVLAGGSAGSICWFRTGVSDARPEALSMVEGLGLLPYSHCPHYAQPERRELYHAAVTEGACGAGYACDDLAGILFINGKAVRQVTQSSLHHSYLVRKKGGAVVSERLESQPLLAKDALGSGEYVVRNIGRKIGEADQIQDSVARACVALMEALRLGGENLPESERQRVMEIGIEQLFLYDGRLAGVVNDAYEDFYGLWYFYNRDGAWVSLGEDIGGDTPADCEITFRDRARMMSERGETLSE